MLREQAPIGAFALGTSGLQLRQGKQYQDIASAPTWMQVTNAIQAAGMCRRLKAMSQTGLAVPADLCALFFVAEIICYVDIER